MFQSYKYIKELGYNKDTQMYSYEFKIIDTDFEEVGVEDGVGIGFVEVYRKRNLPVAPNLILWLKFSSKKYGYSMEQLINWSKKHNPYHAEHEDEINKYLLLI